MNDQMKPQYCDLNRVLLTNASDMVPLEHYKLLRFAPRLGRHEFTEADAIRIIGWYGGLEEYARNIFRGFNREGWPEHKCKLELFKQIGSEMLAKEKKKRQVKYFNYDDL